jgi:8-oxo-dGTP pyrophosphatase MutT (NUDIX family)
MLIRGRFALIVSGLDKERKMYLDLNEVKNTLKARERREIDLDSLKPAAILMPYFIKDGKEHLVLTKRSEGVAHHKGQVAFPGGHQELGEDLQTAALREAHEEVGIDPADVEVLGALDDIVTVSSYRVTPFLGKIPYPYDFVACDDEIAKLLLVPIENLTREENIGINKVSGEALRDHRIYYFEWGGDPIWGATGRIVAQFLNLFYGKDLAI